jgi:hypothetical protein
MPYTIPRPIAEGSSSNWSSRSRITIPPINKYEYVMHYVTIFAKIYLLFPLDLPIRSIRLACELFDLALQLR